jgi:hypothetical protein
MKEYKYFAFGLAPYWESWLAETWLNLESLDSLRLISNKEKEVKLLLELKWYNNMHLQVKAIMRSMVKSPDVLFPLPEAKDLDLFT